MIKKIYFLPVLLFIMLVRVGSASEFPPRPSPVRWVNNLSVEMPGFLSPSQTDSLESKLSAFADQTSNQIVIVIVDTLQGLEPYAYATQLGTQWGVGQAEFDNGIIILIKPTGGEGQRNLFIAVGYGLEGAIPDLTTTQIRENEIYPHFKKGEFYIALDKATDVLMALAKEEYDAAAYSEAQNVKRPWYAMEYTIFGFKAIVAQFLIFILFFSFLNFTFIRSIYRAIKRGKAHWIANKHKPVLTVQRFFENPFDSGTHRFSLLLILLLVLLLVSIYGIAVIIVTYIIAVKRKKPGYDLLLKRFDGISSRSYSGSSSGWSSSSGSSSSSSSSSFGGGSFGGGGSGGNW